MGKLMKTIDPKYQTPIGELSDLDAFTRAYIEAALWSSTDGDNPLDKDHDWHDLAPDTLAEMRQDCAQFQELYGQTIQAAIDTQEVKCGPDFDAWGHAGHDFWLTRCGHGAGFWDGDWPEPQGEHLSDAACKCGTVDLYVGDDGKIYA